MEFEAIPNVSEDTLEIINSLKQIRLRLPNDVEQDTILYEFKQIWAIVSVVMGYFTIPSLIYLILTHIEEKRYEVMLMVEDFNHDSYKKYDCCITR